MKALEIRNLGKSFGGFQALKAIDLCVENGERRAIIGPNGAGKTTFFHVVSGILKPDRGEILFYGRDVTRMAPYLRARLGMGRTFQKNNLLFSLSLEENLSLAMRGSYSPESLRGLLQEAGLERKRRMKVGELSYGEQRQVELLLVLAQKPRMILLDEPTAGMSPVETEVITRIIGALPRDITVLMIEHDMEVVFHLADRITVFHLGEVLCEGEKEAVRADPGVRRVYLGAADGGGETGAGT